MTHYRLKLPQGWRDREAIVRWAVTVLRQTDGGELCDYDLEWLSEQTLFIEYGGDWETSDEQEAGDPDIPVNVRKFNKKGRKILVGDTGL